MEDFQFNIEAILLFCMVSNYASLCLDSDNL